ncbi:alpha/beta hydrolase [uncultured Draconibacterium sp.]|uniref:alpha/beta hydrolase n=1 Tax=uncultured Draconibacterium sp. TaxID=1573823 RepID=UPI0025CF0615|nr:alpha/beta hydrolase [uncultured Draconibacterium sp.]
MRKLVLFFVWLPFWVFAQEAYDFPKDTTFNVQSAYRKIAKDFPQATIVEEFSIPAINEKRNIVYHSFGERDLHIDIFYPKISKVKLAPGVLLIHGGGWASGTKLHLVPMAQKLAEAGYVAATVESRLSPEAKYPASVTDLKTALKWLRIHASEFGLDTAKIATLGTSSGATVASLLGTTGGNPLFPSHSVSEPVSDKVQAVVNIDGILDFTDPNESGKDSDPAKPSAGARWFGATYKQKPELWIEASPLTYVSDKTPPTLFVNSALPRFHAGRDEYLAVLDKNGIYNEMHTIEETPHPFWLFHPWFDEAVPLVISFLDRVLK